MTSGMPASIASTTAALVPAAVRTRRARRHRSSPPPRRPTRTPAGRCRRLDDRRPPFPGVTPPTMSVPVASIRRGVLGALRAGHALHDDLGALGEEDRHGSGPLRCELGHAARGIVHRVHELDTSGRRRPQDPPALVGVVAVEAYDERLGRPRRPSRASSSSACTMPLATASHAVMPPKTLTNTALTSRVAEDDLEPVGHHLRRGAAADVEEVRGLLPAELLPGVGDDVQRAHDQAGAVADDPDRAVELDVVEPLLLGGLTSSGSVAEMSTSARGRGGGSRRSRRE